MRSLDSWPRLAFFAVALPGIIAAFDRWLLSVPGRDWDPAQIVVTYAVFAVQAALLGWAVGIALRNPVVRWIVFVWTLLLIDIQIISVALGDQQWPSPATMLSYAMLSAQAGLLAAWAALGETRWTWRLPIALGAAAGLGVLLLLVNESYWSTWWGYSYELWPAVLVAQSGAALTLCLFLAAAGYRMKTRDEDANSSTGFTAGPRDGRLQFSLKHLMIWMTALGPVILVLRALSVWMTARYGFGQWLEIIILGVCLAMVSLLAVWAAVGAEGAALRIPLLLVLAPVLGAILGLMALWGWWDRMGLRYFSGPERVTYWIIWTTLAGYFLAGLLLIFRAQGCRLERVARSMRITASPPPRDSIAGDFG